MPLQIINQDITKLHCDAIVNPTDPYFSGSGGTDLAVHTAAGPELAAACAQLAPLEMGTVAVTEGFGLASRNIIHTFGPIWQGGEYCEPVLLRSCYLNAMLAACRLGAVSVAFPLISSGTFGFPKDQVLRIALDSITDFLFAIDQDMDVTITVHGSDTFALSREVALKEYMAGGIIEEEGAILLKPAEDQEPVAAVPHKTGDLADWIAAQDDSFTVLLLKLIDKRGMTDVQCYKKANVSRKVFSRMMNTPGYKPNKTTALAYAIALELSLEETEALLKTAGLALSGSDTFDRIVTYYIASGIYDIFEINAALFKYDQKTINC